jgi:hypothetical protein
MSFNPDKADIMVFSITDVGYNFIFSLNGNNIPITTAYLQYHLCKLRIAMGLN